MLINEIIFSEILNLFEQYSLNDFKIVQSSDNIHDVGESMGVFIGYKKENISTDLINGGIRTNDPNELKRVEQLKKQILTNKHISRIIVNNDN